MTKHYTREEIESLLKLKLDWSDSYNMGSNFLKMRSAIGQLLEEIEALKAKPVEPWPKLGSKSTCKNCNKPIIYKDPYWEHIGWSPRHPAIPFKDGD